MLSGGDEELQLDTGIHPFSSIDVGGLPFACTNPAEAVRAILHAALVARTHPMNLPIRFSNAYCVALAQQNHSYRATFAHGITFPDGAPVTLAMRIAAIGTPTSPRRVRGPSFFESALAESEAMGLRHYFLGTTPQTLAKLEARIITKYQNLKIAGMSAPEFGPVDDSWVRAAIDTIAPHEPDLIWVALGTPKQDLACMRLSENLRIPALGVGAAFDFMAGSVREAPHFMQALGLEWLFRLCIEPRRLWRRYLIGNTQFAIATLRQSGAARRNLKHAIRAHRT